MKRISRNSKESEKGEDDDLKAFAAKSLPVLQRHLEMSKKVKTQLK